MPNLESVSVARGQSLGEKASRAFVHCLTSSKADTRNKAESILALCLKVRTVTTNLFSCNAWLFSVFFSFRVHYSHADTVVFLTTQNNVLDLDRMKSCTERMKPAQQRSVGAILTKLSRNVQAAPQSEKENVPYDDRYDEPVQRRPAKPSSARAVTKQPERRHGASGPTGSRTTHDDPSGMRSRDEKPHAPHKETSVHPLICSAGQQGIERSRSALRSMTWPEYPEEPLGSDIFNQLKKAWSPILPPASASSFFPAGGIRKQDDGHAGCDLLVKAILMERAGDGVAVEEHLFFILHWISLVLCSKEHTVGLGALLTASSDIFSYLQEIKYELSDSEALLVVPFILEKASLAKGRFKDVYDDLLVVVKAEDLLPTKRLGSVVAVAMLERASHAKARLAACHDCSRCVDQLGLSGIGKKGVLVAAKALSDEKQNENRQALLSLMVEILSRMNGDVNRFARICGSSLSGKARHLVEERWQEHKASGGPPRQAIEDTSSSRRTRIPTPKKSSPPVLKGPRSHVSKASQPGSSASTVLHEELPALVLGRTKITGSPPTEAVYNATSSAEHSSTHLLSRFNADSDSLGGLKFSASSMLADRSTNAGISSNLPSADSQPSGAAASLRARLLAIRERSKHPEGEGEATGEPQNVSSSSLAGPRVPPRSTTPALVLPSQNIEGPRGDSNAHTDLVASSSNEESPDYVSGMSCISDLLSKPTPLEEADKDLDDGIEYLKKFHAALSKQQQTAVVGMNEDGRNMLRQTIADNVNSMVECLSR